MPVAIYWIDLGVNKVSGPMAARAKQEEISRAFARIRTGVLTFVCAMIGGVGLFVMTAWLLMKGGPHVGQHLQLLSNYFIGYSVTWSGSLVGLFYGALVGGVIGWAVSTLYNKVISLRQR